MVSDSIPEEERHVYIPYTDSVYTYCMHTGSLESLMVPDSIPEEERQTLLDN